MVHDVFQVACFGAIIAQRCHQNCEGGMLGYFKTVSSNQSLKPLVFPQDFQWLDDDFKADFLEGFLLHQWVSRLGSHLYNNFLRRDIRCRMCCKHISCVFFDMVCMNIRISWILAFKLLVIILMLIWGWGHFFWLFILRSWFHWKKQFYWICLERLGWSMMHFSHLGSPAFWASLARDSTWGLEQLCQKRSNQVN